MDASSARGRTTDVRACMNEAMFCENPPKTPRLHESSLGPFRTPSQQSCILKPRRECFQVTEDFLRII